MYLTDKHLRAIEDSLDLLVMPFAEEIRELVAEVKRLRSALDKAEMGRLSLAKAADEAATNLLEAVKEAAT